MSELINRLIEQATIRVNNPTVNSDGKIICDNWEESVSLSLFANLIIDECASWMEDEVDDTGDRIGDSFYWANRMKKHFGVKE